MDETILSEYIWPFSQTQSVEAVTRQVQYVKRDMGLGSGI